MYVTVWVWMFASISWNYNFIISRKIDRKQWGKTAAHLGWGYRYFVIKFACFDVQPNDAFNINQLWVLHTICVVLVSVCPCVETLFVVITSQRGVGCIRKYTGCGRNCGTIRKQMISCRKVSQKAKIKFVLTGLRFREFVEFNSKCGTADDKMNSWKEISRNCWTPFFLSKAFLSCKWSLNI